MQPLEFRWSLKTRLWALGIGLAVTLLALFVFDVCTFDVLGSNPTERYGDMRLAWPRGSVFEVAGISFYDLMALFLIVSSICAFYLGVCVTAVSAAGLLSQKVAITIDDHGIRNWYWSDALVPWAKVKRVDGISWQPDGEVALAGYLTLVVDDPATYLDRATPIWFQRTPFFIKGLHISYVLLDNPVGFVRALLEYGPKQD